MANLMRLSPGHCLYCEARGSSPDLGTDCDVPCGQLLRRMASLIDPLTRFAAGIRDHPRSVRAVMRLSAEVRSVLKIEHYAVVLDGCVRQLWAADQYLA